MVLERQVLLDLYKYVTSGGSHGHYGKHVDPNKYGLLPVHYVIIYLMIMKIIAINKSENDFILALFLGL